MTEVWVVEVVEDLSPEYRGEVIKELLNFFQERGLTASVKAIFELEVRAFPHIKLKAEVKP